MLRKNFDNILHTCTRISYWSTVFFFHFVSIDFKLGILSNHNRIPFEYINNLKVRTTNSLTFYSTHSTQTHTMARWYSFKCASTVSTWLAVCAFVREHACTYVMMLALSFTSRTNTSLPPVDIRWTLAYAWMLPRFLMLITCLPSFVGTRIDYLYTANKQAVG